VHDWDEEILHLAELKSTRVQRLKEFSEGLEVLLVLVGFKSGNLDLLLKLGEGRNKGRLVLLQEFEHFFYAFGVKLVVDRVQVEGLLFPEIDFGHGTRIVAIFKGILRVHLKHILNLLGPVDDGSLQDLGLLL
jgi:hypothetical protein